jgi:hypothetical protein
MHGIRRFLLCFSVHSSLPALRLLSTADRIFRCLVLVNDNSHTEHPQLAQVNSPLHPMTTSQSHDSLQHTPWPRPTTDVQTTQPTPLEPPIRLPLVAAMHTAPFLLLEATPSTTPTLPSNLACTQPCPAMPCPWGIPVPAANQAIQAQTRISDSRARRRRLCSALQGRGGEGRAGLYHAGMPHEDAASVFWQGKAAVTDRALLTSPHHMFICTKDRHTARRV